MVRCLADNIREDDFLRHLKKLIIKYALTTKEYSGVKLSDEESLEIVQSALRSYVRGVKSGEIGELVLFGLLESKRKAPQVLNKMILKTNGELHFNGLDAVHLGVEGKNVRIYYGESKTKKNFNEALTEALESLKDFNSNPSNEDRELTLINRHIDAAKFGTNVDIVKKVLNPYERDRTNIIKSYSIFLGFNYSSISIDPPKLTEGLEEFLKEKLLECFPDLFSRCESKIGASGIEKKIDVFLIPFKDVDTVKTIFQDVLRG